MPRLILDDISFVPLDTRPLGRYGTQARLDTGADLSAVGMVEAREVLCSAIGRSNYDQLAMISMQKGVEPASIIKRIVNLAPERVREMSVTVASGESRQAAVLKTDIWQRGVLLASSAEIAIMPCRPKLEPSLLGMNVIALLDLAVFSRGTVLLSRPGGRVLCRML